MLSYIKRVFSQSYINYHATGQLLLVLDKTGNMETARRGKVRPLFHKSEGQRFACQWVPCIGIYSLTC